MPVDQIQIAPQVVISHEAVHYDEPSEDRDEAVALRVIRTTADIVLTYDSEPRITDQELVVNRTRLVADGAQFATDDDLAGI
jgi:hypothetical protein